MRIESGGMDCVLLDDYIPNRMDSNKTLHPTIKNIAFSLTLEPYSMQKKFTTFTFVN